jgi:antibiotic biosynthesis monooxygenase (ABM) superfamily enzyme
MKTKMKLIAAFKIWVVIYPSITLFLYILSKSSLELPLYLKTLFLTLILVPWVVFIGVPFVDFIMRQLSTEIDKK